MEDLPNGWKFFGKTGCGDLLNDDGSHKQNHHLGWFVGWAQKADRIIVVANYHENREQEYLSGRRAKEESKERLLRLIESDR